VTRTLAVRWLGRVTYREAHDLQRALHRGSSEHLLLLEHPPTYTLGKRARPEHLLVPPASVGAELVRSDRGGDVTYHGPGQLVGYPILDLTATPGSGRDVLAYVRALEAALIDALAALGIPAHRDDRYTGVWVGDAKLAAIGVRVARGRTMHGFALNVDVDLRMFDHIIPCGIRDRRVTSLRALLGDRCPSMRATVDAVVAAFADRFAHPFGRRVDRHDVAWGRATPAPPDPPARLDPLPPRRPAWLRVPLRTTPQARVVRRLVTAGRLHTVCEEAGCPNLSECWAAGTATFMLLGDRCTRACGFCLVDTRRPAPPDPGEPERVADAVAGLGLAHAVITSVARDDLPDGGASVFAATVEAVRRRCPGTTVEVLIPDCKGDPAALERIFAARPDVLNHNLETVPRLQRRVRPSASYARSLAVLARAADAGLVTKTGLMVGLGETRAEVEAAVADARAVGVGILTIGQYLRPSRAHLPVVRYWSPEEFDDLATRARRLGFAHVEAGPLVRSSYHARAGAEAVAAAAAG
jgi:lipoic acid synthetase